MKTIGRILVIMLILVFAVMLVSANHSFSVHSPRLCLNGTSFTARAVTPESFSLAMVAQIFDSSFNLVASGSVYTFHDYEPQALTVSYPEGTFAVGELVVFSASDVPGDLNGYEGAYEYGYIEDCFLSLEAAALDNRINRYDAAAPIAVYFVNGSLEVWAIGADSEGTLVISLSQSELDSSGIGLIESSGSILVFKVEGGFLVRAGMSNGKTYVLSFSELSASAAYESYEE